MARRSSSQARPPRYAGRPGGAGATPTTTALDAGLRYLAGRAHSRLELARKLARKGYEAEEVEGALERLSELGYLDDQAFARALVRRRATSRGPAALAAELASKGIDREGVAAALADLERPAQLEAATRLAERLYAEKPVPSYPELLDRVGPKLLRRGYSAGIVRQACRAVVEGTARDTAL